MEEKIKLLWDTEKEVNCEFLNIFQTMQKILKIFEKNEIEKIEIICKKNIGGR